MKYTLDSVRSLLVERNAKQRAAAIKAIQQTLGTIGLAIIQERIGGMNPPPVDRGTYRRSWKMSKLPGGGMIHNTAPYASIIEKGRRPGARMPPPAVLGEWARRKGLLKKIKGKVNREAAQISIGWALARSIARKGIKARQVMLPVAPKIRELCERAVNIAIRKTP